MNVVSYLPGIILILFGIAVALQPEILVVLVSAFFIMTGIGMIAWAKRLREFLKGSSKRPPSSGMDVYIE